MSRLAGVFAVLFVTALTVATVTATDPPAAATTTRTVVRAPRHIDGIGITGWHTRAVSNRRQINRLRRVLLADPHVTEAINLAAATYGHGTTLWRKARCESRLSARALNNASRAAGLFQFLPSTWNSTPYAGFSAFSPYANALAAGWMHQQGRGGEWVCR